MDSWNDFDALQRHDMGEYLGDQGKLIWKGIEEYYAADKDAHKVDRELLSQSLATKYPKHEELLREVIKSLGSSSGPNVLKLVIGQRLDNVQMRLSQAFASGSAEIETLLEEYEMLVAGDLEASDESEVVQNVDVEKLMALQSDENRFQVLPNSLNTQLEGGPKRGHHLVLFGPTDMGKTLLTLNMIRGLIADGRKVVYVCNEDPMADLVERLLVSICSEIGRDKWDVRKHPRQAGMYAAKRGWGNLVWAELSPGSLGEIRSIVEEHRPDVLVVDQIRNLNVGEKSFVRTLEVAAQGMRNFAKKYKLLAISITQAGDSANGKTILNRGDIDNSNVGIPGSCDLMLGIGASQEQEILGERTLSFPKNKVSGNKVPLPVFFNTKTMRVE